MSGSNTTVGTLCVCYKNHCDILTALGIGSIPLLQCLSKLSLLSFVALQKEYQLLG